MTSELTARDSLRTLGRVNGEFTFYTWHAVAVTAWEGKVSLTGARELNRMLQEFHDQHSRVVVIHLVQDNVGVPDSEARTEFERFAKVHEQKTVCTALLYPREGFLAGAIKSIATGVMLMTGTRFDIRLFTTVDDLVSWVTRRNRERNGAPLDGSELEALLRSILATPS